ncbi:unnamed protein product, partial [Laminaria digitata]
MPADTDRKHAQQQQKSVLLRSDQDSGMALVKSKDGRTKWLTVSADPSSPSFTWDERVRSWASKLGVCAQPPLPPTNQATPLPTPPPDDLGEQQDRWPAAVESESEAVSGATSGSISSITRSATTSGAIPSGAMPSGATPSGAINGASGAISAPETIPPSPDTPPACSPVATKKPPGNAKRVGSFARGFLLGLGGGGGSGGGGGGGPPPPPPPRRRGEGGRGAVAGCAESAPASTLPDTSGVKASQGDCGDGGGGSCGAERGGVSSSAVSGRDRWVKGAPDSPYNSSDDGDGDSDGGLMNDNNRGVDSGGGGGGGGGSACVGSLPRSSSAPAANAAAAGDAGGGGAGAGAGGMDGDTGMAWLETGPGNGTGSGSGSVKTASKKKKKSKAKGKGGKAKKACPGKGTPSLHELTGVEGGAGGGGGGGGTTAASAAAAAAASAVPGADASSSSKAAAKRARSNKQRKALNVTFGCVRLLEFTRDVGGCGVPGHGTWGLALGLPFRETSVEVDGYEASKTEILEERTSELSKRQRHLSTGETRQFDHRPAGERNPLFDRLDEKERSKKLLDYACFHKGDLKEVDRDSSQNSNDNDNHNHNLSRSHSQPERGADTSGLRYCSRAVSHAEFVDKSHAASPELTALRHSRTVSQGCNCACVRADKLNLAKLRGELNKRGLKASGSKKELAKVLQEAMRREDEEDGGMGHKVCRSEDCQCVKDGKHEHRLVC